MKNYKISRRSFLKAACVPAAASLIPFSRCSAADSKRPNIIVLITDDQRASAMGCMGNDIIQTPNMDSLANNGVLFTNAFVTTSICCTSRASIFTGQYAQRHGIYTFGKHFTPEAFKNIYPAVLKKTGYRTGFIGKYGVGGAKTLPVDKFDYWKGFAGQGHYEKNVDKDGNQIHITKKMGNDALEFLDGCSSNQPFCLQVSFKAPHCQDGDPRQFLYDPEYKDLYKDITIPDPPVGTDEYFEMFPEFFQKNNESRKRWKIRFSTPELYQEMVKGYYRLIYGVDVQIGKIRQKLEQMGVADNTVIMLMGDNGFFLGEHGLAGKWYPQEESIRVPLIIYDQRQPSANRSKRKKQMALNIDLAPTICSMAKVDTPDCMQGQDLTPILSGKNPEWRNEFYYDHLLGIPTIRPCEGLVTGRYKYFRYPESEPVYEELYDLASDPHEINNLATKGGYQNLLTDLRNRCDLLKEKAK